MAKTSVVGRKTKVATVLFIILVLCAAYLLGWSSFFTVKQITVQGAPTAVAARAIEQSSRITKGEKLARVEPRVTRSLLANISWLDRSTVSRNWLRGSVVIRVWPRTPIATYQGRLIDRAGIVFDLPNIDARGLPFISASDSSSAQFAISLLTQLPTTLQAELLGLKVSSLNSATLTLKDISQGSTKVLQVVWGDSSNMALKVKVYQALIALPENTKITEMDLSAPHAPIVK